MSQEQGTGREVWVMRRPCGCPRGVVDVQFAPSQSQAWKEFFPRVRQRDAAMDDGVTFERIGWDEYRANVAPLMTAKCPHAEVTS